jgi:hypothetical protein
MVKHYIDRILTALIGDWTVEQMKKTVIDHLIRVGYRVLKDLVCNWALHKCEQKLEQYYREGLTIAMAEGTDFDCDPRDAEYYISVVMGEI